MKNIKQSIKIKNSGIETHLLSVQNILYKDIGSRYLPNKKGSL